jgi:TPR repeat protein
MRATVFLLLGVTLAAAVCPAAEAPAGELLDRAEALWRGRDGTFDRTAAEGLFEQAAATGDPAATFRLALILDLRKPRRPEDAARARQLHRRSAAAVERLANQGDPYTQYLMGTAALSPLFGPVDYRSARLWLELAAEENVSWAWHNLAWMMEEGLGFAAADPKGALAAYRRAAEKGNSSSMYDFARLALVAGGSRELCEEGRDRLERAASSGHPRATAYLGKMLLFGGQDCIPAAPAEALRWLRNAAGANEPGAQYDLGLALLTGAAGAEGRPRALAHLEPAAAQNDAIAVELLALLHASGIAVPRDPVRARELMAEAARLQSDGLVRLGRDAENEPLTARLVADAVRRLEKLAGQGDVAAKAFLSHLYLYGQGTARDPERAVRLAQDAAAAGDAAAMRVLGSAYTHGLGVRRDTAAGLRWFRLGADGGDSFCMMFYSQYLMQGELVERDLMAGLSWLTLAGEAGNWWAMNDLGKLHDEGWYGLPRNPSQAVRWKRLLAELGDAEARGWLAYHGHATE